MSLVQLLDHLKIVVVVDLASNSVIVFVLLNLFGCYDLIANCNCVHSKEFCFGETPSEICSNEWLPPSESSVLIWCSQIPSEVHLKESEP